MEKKYIEITDQKDRLGRSLHTLSSLVGRNVHNQYRDSVLGVLWTVLSPLLNMAVISFVFITVLNRKEMDGVYYPLFYLSGSIVFNLLRNATSNALPCMVTNRDLLTKTRVAQEIFPLSNVLSATVDFFFAFLAMLALMLVLHDKAGVGFHLTLLMTIFPFLPAFVAFTLGLAFLLSALYVRFRDVKHIYAVLLTLWGYLTPLFYSVSIIHGHEREKFLLTLNPMYHYVTYFREILQGVIPSFQSHLLLYGWGLGVCAMGFFTFRLSKRRFLMYI